ncbi:helix-turn-helix domain-containing protein [Vagococcus salmoninarum]|uniref:helix-turn-helix domain-containing protein n=1 Tax=Vagococcus salmoninarum TaxID=2739 RepID=UPI0028D2BD7D|nr:helix-turn-helix domain-containing protein [Vagococcus salmoninarum]
MRSLLSERDLRIVLVLEILMSSEWVSLTTLTNYLNCSEKTIRNDLGLISTEFEEIVIESSPQLGYHLVRSNAFPIENTVDQIINNTLVFQLLRLLLESSHFKLTELESLLFVSANSIRNVVKDFNHKLAKDHVSIESRPFRIEGDERKITSLFFIRLQQSYFSRGMLEDEIFTFLKEIIPTLFTDNPELKDHFSGDLHSLNILLYIRFYREINGHSHPKNQCAASIDYSLITDKVILKRFYQLFHHDLTNELLNNISNFLLEEDTAIDYLQLIFSFNHTHEYLEINQTLHPMILQLADKLMLPFDEQTDFNQIIQPSFKQFTNFPFNYEIHHTLLRILKYEHNSILSETLEYKYQTFFNNRLLIQLAYHLQVAWPDLLERITFINKKMHVAILLVADRETKALFENYLIFHFTNQVTFYFLDNYTDNESHDLLITNNFDYPLTQTPVLNIAGLPNDYLYQRITELYHRHQQKSYLERFTNN